MTFTSELFDSSNLTGSLDVNHSALLSSAVMPGLTESLQQNSRVSGSSSTENPLISDRFISDEIGDFLLDPGNTLNTAHDIGSLSATYTTSNFVGSSDTSDFYGFSLDGTSNFNLSLTGLSSDADVRLIQDLNGNSIFDYDLGEQIAYSNFGSTFDESINLQSLAAGDYFVQVYQYSGDTDYNLNLTATPNVVSTPTPSESTADWTFMVYLDGDNNLESFAIDDFMEMAGVGSNSDVNIVVEMDRATGYSNTDGDWTDTRRGLVEAGSVPDQSWGTSIGEVNMGDQSTLTDFISWGMSNYQAENYGVVLWNHGGGWNSIASDDSSGDLLIANEVSGALAGFSGIDLIGADACLMGMVEFAAQISNSASVFVGSEQNEPGDGWSYDTILADLTANPTWTAAQLGTAIVNRYGESYGGAQTLSAIDLSMMDGLSTATSQLATTIMNNATSYDISQLRTYRDNSAYYGQDQLGHRDYRDLGTILSNLASDTTITSSIRIAAETALAAYESAIIQNHSGSGEGATGLSIYFQPADASPDAEYNSLNSTFAANTAWDEFLNWWA